MNRFPPLSVAEITARLDVDLQNGTCTWKDATKHHRPLNGLTAGFKKITHSNKAYWIIKFNGRPYRRAQLILTVATGQWPCETVDHIDGDSLNDKAANLRHATVMQNAWNHKRRKKKSPFPMGVKRLAEGRYQARIAVNKKQISLGVYPSPEQASEVYQAARKEHFHDFC